jgi:hypothetical protein
VILQMGGFPGPWAQHPDTGCLEYDVQLHRKSLQVFHIFWSTN